MRAEFETVFLGLFRVRGSLPTDRTLVLSNWIVTCRKNPIGVSDLIAHGFNPGLN